MFKKKFINLAKIQKKTEFDTKNYKIKFLINL